MKLKGIVIGLALTLAFTMTGQAISIQELQSSPQFKVIHESRPDVPGADERTTWYLDTGSLEVLEYTPPVYKIKAYIYNVYQSPRKHVIYGDSWIVTYDVRQSLASQVYRAKQNRASLTTAIQSAQSASGMEGLEQDLGSFSFDGTPLPRQKAASKRAILRTQPNTTRYDIADILFYEAYHMHFDDIVVK
ncbi:hypothetical protein VEHSUH05_04970 [Veillonella denticariosi JCM 15641]|uniref:Uncharacterized protein n=1 Tax=Veillonella denticariosi JCM 15641 TaxID=1298594 RepID=A0A2S7ZAU9_9FIRM|nr:hypothetical protein [Veillonella denticariosi]PQL20418.1 hypothetical protein VEHSUH05_04970 [Veillonella denticariosi JCM 15641]